VIQRGIFRHWERSASGRAATMALLSGYESRIKVFLGQYVRVVGQSTRCILAGEIDRRASTGRAASLSGLVRTSLAKLERTLAVAYQDAGG
jgi:hypothetical protein